MQYVKLEDTVFLYFGATGISGSGGDGANPKFVVREGGAATDAASIIAGGVPDLLTHGDYPPGCYEVAVPATAANGFAANKTYAVFSTLLIEAQNPTGYVGSFRTEGVYLASTGLDLINVSGFAMPLAIEIVSAAVAGKVSGVGGGTETYVGIDGVTDKFVSTIDAAGNRTGVTYP